MQLFFILCNIIAFNPVFTLPVFTKRVKLVSTQVNDTQASLSQSMQVCESACTEKNVTVLDDSKFQIAQPNAVISEATAGENTLAPEIEISSDDIAELSSQKAMISRAIMDAKLQIAGLNTVIEKATVDVSTLLSEIEILNDDISELASQKAMIQEYHANEHARFTVDDKDYFSAVDAGHRALRQDIQSSIDQATMERSDKMAVKAQREQAKAEAQASLLDITASTAADTQYLDILTKEISAKATQSAKTMSVFRY